MRSLLGRFHRPMSRGLVNNMLTMNNLGDGSTLNLDFTTMGGVLDPRLTFTRSTTATYINSSGYVTSAAINAPRFDYSPTNIGEPRGLLIEGQGVNLARYSETLETTGGYWGYNAATRTVESSDVNPTNGTGSISFGPTSNGGSRYCGLFLTGQTTTTAYTFSAWIKAKGTSSAVVSIQNSAGAVNSTVTILSQPSGANASIAGNGGGFPRLSSLSSSGWTKIQVVTSSTLGGTGALNVFVYPNDTSTQTTADTMFMWGAQLEAGSGASSYIPTGASQVTRNGDDCYMSGTNFSSWWNQSEGTAFIETVGMTKPTDLTYRAFTITEFNSVPYQIGATWIYDNSGFRITELASSATKHAVALKANDFAISNGSSSIRTGTGAFGTTYNRLQLGAYENQTSYMNGCIKRFKYFPTRLSNAQLQALTAP